MGPPSFIVDEIRSSGFPHVTICHPAMIANFSERAITTAFNHSNAKTAYLPTTVPGTVQVVCVAHKISNMRR